MVSMPLAYGQSTLPNGGFENWQNVGTNTEEPTNWNGNKTGGGFANLGPQTCFRDNTNPHSGTYSLQLRNGSLFGTPVNATATTGKIEAPSTNPADGYIHTITADSNFNATFTDRPDSLVGWFRFSQSGTDIGRIQAILHDNFDVSNPDQGGSAAHIIAEATFDLPNGNTSTWTRFAVPFNYNNGNMPTHILLIATASSSVGSASIGTTLWVDDLDVVYCTTARDTLTEIACNSFTSPSGNYTWTNSGTYQDTVVGAAGNCDSIYTINLTINTVDRDTLTEVACNSFTSPSGNYTWTNSGTYQDTVVGTAGNCDSIYTINLTINTVDTSVTLANNVLTANVATGATYQWVDCNNGNATIAGATNASFTPTANGNYAVEVTQNGCTATSSCYNVVLSNIHQLANSTLVAYPNPTTGQFSIDLGATNHNANIRITDVNGKVVYNATTEQQVVEINLEGASGFYFVAITTKEQQTIIKLIKN